MDIGSETDGEMQIKYMRNNFNVNMIDLISFLIL